MTRRARKSGTIRGMDAKTAQLVDAEIANLIAESAKLNAEAAKFHRERAWYPVVLMTTAIGATAALVKMFLS